MKLSDKKKRIADPLRRQFEEKGISQDLKSIAQNIVNRAEIYYLGSSTTFLVPEQDGGFTRVPFSGCITALQAAGVDSDLLEDKKVVSSVRSILIHKRSVDSILNLAGYPRGVARMLDGSKVLIPRGMQMLDSKQGDAEPMLTFMSNLFTPGQALDTVLSWLKIAITDGLRCAEVGVHKASIRPSQVLIIVGPPGCGKTLFSGFVAKIFGNTIANPYPFFCGDTSFNSELLTSILLLMDDVAESVLPQVRHSLAKRLKEFLVNPNRRVHPKGLPAMTVQTFQRVMMMANEDSLGVLPALEPDFLDKVILVEAHPSADVSAFRDDFGRQEWYSRITEALPAFVNYLRHDFVIPETLLNSRYGVQAYQDPRLLYELRGESNARELLMSLTSVYFEGERPLPGGDFIYETCTDDPTREFHYWRGTSHEFQSLVAGLPQDQGWARLFPYSNSAGMFLGGLARTIPDEVQALAKCNGTKRWRVRFGGGAYSTKRRDADGVPTLPQRRMLERVRELFPLEEE